MILENNEREFNGKVIRIDKYDGYDFINYGGILHYTLLDYDIKLGVNEITNEAILDETGNQAYTIFKTPVLLGTIELPIDIANQWGEDDDIIFNWLKNTIDNGNEAGSPAIQAQG